MAKVMKPPERADGEVRPEGLPGLASILSHAPQLTKSWGPFRAFLGVLTCMALLAMAVRPEAALVMGVIYLACIGLAGLATYMRWLD
jgi:hypothetical protein